MKVKWIPEVICPKCDGSMVKNVGKLMCGSPGCKKYLIPYELPEMELKKAKVNK